MTSGGPAKHGHWLPKVEVRNEFRKAIDCLLKVYQIDEFRSIWSVGCFPRACEVGWGENERTSQPQMLCWTYFSTSNVAPSNSIGTSRGPSKYGPRLPKKDVCNVLRKAIDSLLNVYQIDEFRSIWSVDCFPFVCDVGPGKMNVLLNLGCCAESTSQL